MLLIGPIQILLVLVLGGFAQIVLPAILARLLPWRVGPGAPVLIPRSGFAALWLAQLLLVGLAAFIAGRLWAADSCFEGVTGSPFCDSLTERQGRRLQAAMLIGVILAVGTPVGALIAALAERAARKSAAPSAARSGD